MRTVAALVGTVLLLAGCSGSGHVRTAASPTTSPSPAPAVSMAACPVTKPSHSRPPRVAVLNWGQVLTTAKHGWVGSGGLWVELPPRGVLETELRDGFLEAKFAWFRATPGQVVVIGQPMDSTRAPFKADVGTVPEYGPTGFTASGLSFGRAGCWRVTGTLGQSRLSLVLQVVQVTAP